MEVFDAAWREADDTLRTSIWVVYGLIGLTRLGEWPVEVDRFAAYLNRSVEDAVALVDQYSGVLFTAQVGDGVIALDLARPAALRRRTMLIGDRRIPVSGCAPDLFEIASVLDVGFTVEDTCPATGVPIRVEFVPPVHRADLVATVDPVDTVVALDPRVFGQASDLTPEQIDASLCVQMPFFANANAAHSWLSAHPSRRVCPARQMYQLDIITYHRDVLRPEITAQLAPGRA
nr:hypothetical protein [Kibdelosporangium sp. MJ126-NF4]